MNRRKMCLVGSAIAMMILILDSRAAAEAAWKGVDACLRTVIPALFPFFFISGYLTGNLNGGGPIAKLFHSPPNCGTLILTGLLGGYPLGARLAAEQYRAGILTKKQADRLLWFCSQAGPSFFFGIVAAQMDNPGSAWLLWGIQILSALSVSRMLPSSPDKPRSCAKPHSKSVSDAMRAALNAIVTVCGWIVLFHVIIAFFQRWILWLLPETVQVILCGILELTNGCLMLADIPNPQTRFLLGAVMLNFGGFCVMIQTKSLTENLDFQGYMFGKCLQTLFSVLYAWICLGHIWPFMPLFCIFLFHFGLAERKKDSISRKIVV